MDISTWEEFVQYDWQDRDIVISVDIENGILYYTLEDGVRRRWFNTTGMHPDYITRSWRRVEPLTPQEKVCKKIALMEARWANYQARKQHAG